MVYQLVVLVVIPIILTIVTYPPLGELEETQEIEAFQQEDGSQIVFFILMVIWFLFLIRILYQLKKGTFKIRAKY